MEGDGEVLFRHRGYSIRHWRPADREATVKVIKQCLQSYGLNFEPQGADKDAIEVEEFYQKEGRGEFWVAEDDATGELVGTAAYYEVEDKGGGGMEEEEKGSAKSVEIRKMYLAREARGKKLGRTLLQVCIVHCWHFLLFTMYFYVSNLHLLLLNLCNCSEAGRSNSIERLS